MPTNIVVPDLGESVVEATVLRWLKQEGELVVAGETLLELETEKVNLEVSAPSAGVLKRIEYQAGENVKIGDVLGVIAPAPEEAKPPIPSEGTGSSVSPPPSAAETSTVSALGRSIREEEEHVSTSTPRRPSPRPFAASEVRATPVAQRMAEEHGIDLRQIPPSSPDQRITKQDVELYLEKQKAKPSPQGATAATPENKENLAKGPEEITPASPAKVTERADREERVPMSRRRQTIARRLVEAQHTAAMLTTFNEVDMTGVMGIRKEHRESFKQRFGVGLGITSFFVKAVIGALKVFPRLNAEIQGDEMVLKHYYDIGIAVGAAEGLVVPVLRDADRMSFPEIEKRINDFAQKAETNALTLEDLRGGTFTITNGGVFGSLLSTPILNPPQVGILGLHKIEERPIAREGQVVIRPMMYIALTYDHRIVDGREAVQMLVRVKELIEDPTALLLEG